MGPELVPLLSQMNPLHTFFPPQNIIRVIKSRRMRWEEFVARMGEMRNAFRILVDKLEGKRSPRRSWEDNIKIKFREVRCEVV
jgi:hypothetical protein